MKVIHLEEVRQAAIKLMGLNWHLLVLLHQIWAQHLQQILDSIQEVSREPLIPVHLHYESIFNIIKLQPPGI
jgi:hypothetical protein